MKKGKMNKRAINDNPKDAVNKIYINNITNRIIDKIKLLGDIDVITQAKMGSIVCLLELIEFVSPYKILHILLFCFADLWHTHKITRKAFDSFETDMESIKKAVAF